MITKKIQRKVYKALHPVVGEIWAFHRVVGQRSEKAELRSLEVTPEWFESMLLERQRKGCRFVSIDQLPSRGQWVCVTFDDGYHDTYALARPILQRLGIPFTVYVATSFVDNRSEMWWYSGQSLALSTNELCELARDPLCTLGAHTVSHVRLDQQDAQSQRNELLNSKRELERLTGTPILHASFPHGAYNEDTLRVCRELGFKTVTTSWGGPLRYGTHPWPLPRIDMRQP